MRRYKLFVFVFLILACSKELDLNLDSTGNKLVIQCTFSTGSGFEAFFSKTANITGEYENIGKLEISVLENGKIIHSSETDTNCWKFKYSPGKECQYKIEVSDESGNAIYAESRIPELVPLIGASLTRTERTITPGEGPVTCGEVTVTFFDPADQENYYRVIVYSGENTKDYWTNFAQSDPVLENEGDLDYGAKSIFFSDELINGEAYSLRIISPDVEGYYSYGKWEFSPHYIKFQSITKEYYLYLKYLTRHLHNQQLLYDDPDVDMLFLGEPIDMYSNIENGYGIFSGYSSVNQKLK